MSTAISPSPDSEPVSDVLSIFQRLLPASFVQRLQHEAGIRQNNRVYTPLVVLWLLIFQRLHGAVSMEAAVLELLPTSGHGTANGSRTEGTASRYPVTPELIIRHGRRCR